MLPDCLVSLLVQPVVIALYPPKENLIELRSVVVLKKQVLIEPGLESRVAVNKPRHKAGVSRHDDHKIIPVILHGLEDRVDGLLAKVLISVFRSQGIGFVNKQHAAQGLLDHLLGLDGRLAHIARHQAAAIHLHQVSLAEKAQSAEDLSHNPGHGGLAGAGIAGEHQVERQLRTFEAPLLPQRPHLHQVHQAVHVLLHRVQADEAVQLRHSLLQGGLGGLRRLLCSGIAAPRLRSGGAFLRRSPFLRLGRHRQRIQRAADRGLRRLLSRGAEKVPVQRAGSVPGNYLAEFVHNIIELTGGLFVAAADPAQVVLRPRSKGNGGHPRLVAHLRQLVIQQRDPPALSKGKVSVTGCKEHQEVLLDFRKGTAVAGAAANVVFRQLLEKLRYAHRIARVLPVIADGLFKLSIGKAHRLAGINLTDGRHAAAPARRPCPQAEGTGPEIGVHLLGGDPQLRWNTLAKMADAVGIVLMKFPVHGYLRHHGLSLGLSITHSTPEIK